MFKLKSFSFLLIFFMSFSALSSQSVKQLIREGNKMFEQEKYPNAEIYYRRALEENPGNSKALYNLSNALYQQGRYDEAINILDGLTQKDFEKIDLSDVYHNLGNAQLGAYQIKNSIESYKNALKIDPDDHDTRYNLAYAMNLLDEQEQQPQDKPVNGEDEKESKQEYEKPKQDSEDKKDPDKEKQQQILEKLSQEDAERILDALNRQEEKLQEKIQRQEEEKHRAQPEKDW